MKLKTIFASAALMLVGSSAANALSVPEGFVALFNGKDLAGWRGGTTSDHRKLLEMSDSDRAEQIRKWTESMLELGKGSGKPHWTVENEELVNDGFGAYATTEKDYGDFELLVEYKTVPKADSGIYLRGVPQVQIWDSTEDDPKGKSLGKPKGSGGLWNNGPEGAPGRDPLVKADKPFGEWNKFRIVMVGSRVSVWLNDQMVVDHQILENYYDRGSKDAAIKGNPRPVPAKGPIQLQTHGGEIRWRNVFIREIAGEEANRILASKGGGSEWKSLFNGKDFSGWKGPVDNYEVVDGAIGCKAGKGGTIYGDDEFANFKARVEFQVPPGGNNGLAIRYPGQGDTAYVGLCELQVLDDSAPKYAKLDPRQYHGSVYGVVAAHRGYQRPVGEWNFQEVTVDGSKIRVELNGNVIVNADVSTVTEFMGGKPHAGISRTSGFFGFAGHGDAVKFRNVSVLKLP